MNEYLNVLRYHYADFSGRVRRRTYWLFTLVNGIIATVFAVALLITSAPMMLSEEASAPGGPAFMVGILLFVLYSLVIFVPSLALAVRRLHDTGKSGWWYLLSFVPFGNLVLLVFMVLDSDPGANAWGANPKGLADRPAAAANW